MVITILPLAGILVIGVTRKLMVADELTSLGELLTETVPNVASISFVKISGNEFMNP